MRPGNEIEQVLLQICASAGDRVHFVLANHLCQRHAQLGGAHRPGERNHHFPTVFEMFGVGIGGVL